MSLLISNCFICNSSYINTKVGVANLFETTFKSGKRLHDVISELLDKKLTENDVKDRFLCKNCNRLCADYDLLQSRLKAIKFDVITSYNKHQSPSKETSESGIKKIVLPASKLKPLPPKYIIIDQKKLAEIKKKNLLNEKDIKPTTSNVSRVTPTKVNEIEKKGKKLGNKISVINFDVEQLPNNFLEVSKKEIEDSSCISKDEQPMEIDEDCTFIKKNNRRKVFLDIETEKQNLIKSINNKEVKPFDINILPNMEDGEEKELDDDKFIVDRVEIMAGDENVEENTILMENEDGSYVRVMAGQKFMYGDQEISLMLPQDDSQDNQDSNDESQIELQVSGDEETANAIIAAAKDDIAFIKVEGSEVFRFKSIQKDSTENEIIPDEHQIVERNGSAYRCLLCPIATNSDGTTKSFTTISPSELTNHMKSVHAARLYVCNVCGVVIRRKCDYIKHVAAHGDSSLKAIKKSTFKCDDCQKIYSSKNLLKEHMNIHNGVRPYTCDVCSKTFATKYTCTAHMKTHADRPRAFKCKLCTKSFYSQQNLNQHEKTHWGIKDFVCKVCGKAFGTQHNLEVHGIVHSGVRPFLCGVCGKAFARKQEVRDHIRTHTGERPFACSICGATFAQRSNLQSHVRTTHGGERRHACEMCPKRFKRRRLLDYHIKATHTGERPHECEVCHATFVYPEHYKKHMRIHSGERPYFCEVCGKSFNTQDNRNAHRFVHSDKKPYECLVCGAGFMRKPQLYGHMSAAGHMAESIVVNQPRVAQASETDNTIIHAVDGTQILAANKSDSNEDDETTKVYVTTADGGKSTLNVIADNDETTLISIAQKLAEGDKIDANLLETITGEEIAKGTQITATDENGDLVELVQIQLPNGGNGWIAIK